MLNKKKIDITYPFLINKLFSNIIDEKIKSKIIEKYI